MSSRKKKHHYFRTLFFIIILLISLIIIYGRFLGTYGVVTKEYSVKSSKLPKTFNSLKIAHFADILYKNEEDMYFFDTISEKINSKDVDIIIFTGGLINSNTKLNEKDITNITNKLKSLESKYGKYYITGKDDKNNQSYENIMQNSGFTSLNDSVDTIYNEKNDKILLTGINTKSDLGFINEALKNNDQTYKIVFFHESDLFEDLKDYNFDLALSSNSLNGQINIPGIKEYLLDKDSKEYYKPYYKDNNTDYYITSGIGTRSINFRLLNKPSISIYKLENAE